MPYDGTQSNLQSFINDAPTNGNGAGSPDGTGYYPNTLTDFGIETDFYDKAFSWEPKYQHKFILQIDGIPGFLIKTSAKPSLTNGEVVLDHINVKRKLKGKSSWNSIAITMYDAIMPSGAQAVMEWVRMHHESATGRDGYASMYKKDITLHQLSPLGEIIEEWTLKGTFISESSFGDLDWSTEDAVNITATLRYDWAFLNY